MTANRIPHRMPLLFPVEKFLINKKEADQKCNPLLNNNFIGESDRLLLTDYRIPILASLAPQLGIQNIPHRITQQIPTQAVKQ